MIMKKSNQKLPKFTIVMPLIDTPRERSFVLKSIPSALALKPNEFIIGVDAPASDSLITYLEDIIKKNSVDVTTRIVQTIPSNEWRMQLCNVMWNCYMQSSNDKILTFYADSVLRHNVLKGLYLVGNENNVIVSLTPKLLVKNLSDFIRHCFHKQRTRRNPSTTGLFWIYRPFYLQDMDIEEYKKIQNGADTWMYDRIYRIGKHNVIPLKDIGSNSLDYENEDYPWRQFQVGVWFSANYNSIRSDSIKKRQKIKRSKLHNLISRFIDHHPAFYVFLHAFLYQHIWVWRGFKWASKHQDHIAVQKARNISLNEYCYSGIEYIFKIHNWKKTGNHPSTGLGNYDYDMT